MYFVVTIPGGVGREMVKWEMWGPEMPGGHPKWTSLITCSSSIVESPPFISSSFSDDIGGYGDCAEAEDSVLSSIEEDHEENQTLIIIKFPILKTVRFVHLSNCRCKGGGCIKRRCVFTSASGSSDF